MDCLKLTYKEPESKLRIAYRAPSKNEIIAQGFISIDPLADKYAQLNPYNYADNNPIGDLDIDGMQNTQSGNTVSTKDKPNQEYNYSKSKSRGVTDTEISEQREIEVNNLPVDPRDGQSVEHNYGRGDVEQTKYTYNKETDTWNYTLTNRGSDSAYFNSEENGHGFQAEHSKEYYEEKEKLAEQKKLEIVEKVGETIKETDNYLTPTTMITDALADGLYQAADRLPSSDGLVPWGINKFNTTYDRLNFTDNNTLFKMPFKIKQSWAKKLSSTVNGLNKVAPFIGGAATLYDTLKDGEISSGDITKGILFGVGTAIPVIGLGLGAADLIGGYFFDTSATDFIAASVESFIKIKLDIPWW